MARFFKEDTRDFLPYESIHMVKHDIFPRLVEEYKEISEELEITKWELRAHELMFATL